MMKGAIIVDLDGTIALDHERAVLHLNLTCACILTAPVGAKKDCTTCGGKGTHHRWEEYFSMCSGDRINEPIRNLIHRFKTTHNIYIISGRSMSAWDETVKWLKKHDVYWDYMILRAVEDRTDDFILKLEKAKEYGLSPDNVEFVLEDRQRVVDAWRAAGYTCLQVAPGNF